MIPLVNLEVEKSQSYKSFFRFYQFAPSTPWRLIEVVIVPLSSKMFRIRSAEVSIVLHPLAHSANISSRLRS